MLDSIVVSIEILVIITVLLNVNGFEIRNVTKTILVWLRASFSEILDYTSATRKSVVNSYDGNLFKFITSSILLIIGAILLYLRDIVSIPLIITKDVRGFQYHMESESVKERSKKSSDEEKRASDDETDSVHSDQSTDSLHPSNAKGDNTRNMVHPRTRGGILVPYEIVLASRYFFPVQDRHNFSYEDCYFELILNDHSFSKLKRVSQTFVERINGSYSSLDDLAHESKFNWRKGKFALKYYFKDPEGGSEYEFDFTTHVKPNVPHMSWNYFWEPADMIARCELCWKQTCSLYDSNAFESIERSLLQKKEQRKKKENDRPQSTEPTVNRKTGKKTTSPPVKRSSTPEKGQVDYSKFSKILQSKGLDIDVKNQKEYEMALEMLSKTSPASTPIRASMPVKETKPNSTNQPKLGVNKPKLTRRKASASQKEEKREESPQQKEKKKKEKPVQEIVSDDPTSSVAVSVDLFSDNLATQKNVFNDVKLPIPDTNAFKQCSDSFKFGERQVTYTFGYIKGDSALPFYTIDGISNKQYLSAAVNGFKLFAFLMDYNTLACYINVLNMFHRVYDRLQEQVQTPLRHILVAPLLFLDMERNKAVKNLYVKIMTKNRLAEESVREDIAELMAILDSTSEVSKIAKILQQVGHSDFQKRVEKLVVSLKPSGAIAYKQ